MYHYATTAEVINDAENTVSFVVKLKSGSTFVLNECYFTIHKDLFEKYPESDYFSVDLYSECDENKAKEKIKRAIDLLIYMTGIPYEIGYLQKDNNISCPIVNCSKQKLERINMIASQYARIRNKRELLENALRLFSLLAKHSAAMGDAEEAFFSAFRIIEKIAKDEFGIEHTNIAKGLGNIRLMLQDISQNVYSIKIPSNKLDDLAGKFASEIFDDIFSDIYAKSAWFCNRHGIPYDEEVLGKAVKIRNKLAHGDNISIDFGNGEYKLIEKLADEFIHAKFFRNVPSYRLEGKMILIE